MYDESEFFAPLEEVLKVEMRETLLAVIPTADDDAEDHHALPRLREWMTDHPRPSGQLACGTGDASP